MENAYIPKCCNEHRDCISKSKSINLNIARWQFPEKSMKTRVVLDVEEEKPLDKVMKIIAHDERKHTIRHLSSHLELAEIARIANLFDIDIESETSSADFKIPSVKLLRDSELLEEKDIKQTNTYEDFFTQQIFEEKEILKPIIYADILKKDFKKKVIDFCKWTEKAVPMGDSISGKNNESNNKNSKCFKSEKMHELFKTGLRKPSLCPYIPCVIRETKVMSNVIPKLRKSKRTIKKNEKNMLAFKQAYYIPPDERFRKEKKPEGKKLLESEIEFFISKPIQQYIKYLDDNDQPLPYKLENLRRKYKNLVDKKRKNDGNMKISY